LGGRSDSAMAVRVNGVVLSSITRGHVEALEDGRC
jgi:hypothetical protein